MAFDQVTSRAKRAALLKPVCAEMSLECVLDRHQPRGMRGPIELPWAPITVEVFRSMLQSLPIRGLTNEPFDFLHCLR